MHTAQITSDESNQLADVAGSNADKADGTLANTEEAWDKNGASKPTKAVSQAGGDDDASGGCCGGGSKKAKGGDDDEVEDEYSAIDLSQEKGQLELRNRLHLPPQSPSFASTIAFICSHNHLHLPPCHRSGCWLRTPIATCLFLVHSSFLCVLLCVRSVRSGLLLL
jgi:hypothetical protein